MHPVTVDHYRSRKVFWDATSKPGLPEFDGNPRNRPVFRDTFPGHPSNRSRSEARSLPSFPRGHRGPSAKPSICNYSVMWKRLYQKHKNEKKTRPNFIPFRFYTLRTSKMSPPGHFKFFRELYFI